jgi:membrane protein DedA with SNARE-associated domain
MGIVTEILGYIGKLCIDIINFLGYPGVFVLMALESMIFPLPSELVMPFAGFLVATGKMNFWFVVIASSLGSITGSLISYYIGCYGGEKFVLKWGKFFLLEENDLKITEKYFAKNGEKTIFISRFIPVIRHLISIPAGIGKMDIKKFSIYTLFGATLWNTFLAWLGYILGKNWEKVKQYSEYISIPVAIILVGLGIYFVVRHFNSRKHLIKRKN